MTSQVQRGGKDTAANHSWSTPGSGCFTSRKDPIPIVQIAERSGLKVTVNVTPTGLDPWNFQLAPSESYPYTGLDSFLGFQKVEAPRIFRLTAHAHGRVAIPTRRQSLPPRRYSVRD